jgi:predicted Zn-dependent protease
MERDGLGTPDYGRWTGNRGRGRQWGSKGWAGLALAAAAALLLLPASQAAFQTNLGAVAQARAELAAFRPPETPIQDALRRDGTVNLAPAEARYRAALALDPDNVTANRRLGQIELSRGQYEAARGHLTAAYDAAPGQRGTRLLLGESFAAGGNAAEAARLWSRLEGTEVALAERAWWYGYLGDQERQERMTEAARRAGEQ